MDKFIFECEEDKLRIMSWTGSSPSFWIENANEDSQMLMDKLGDEMSHIHQAIGERKRAEFRRLISYYGKIRDGKIGPAIRAVSDKVMNSYDMQSLRLDEENTLAE